jgi:hypothetical protein
MKPIALPTKPRMPKLLAAALVGALALTNAHAQDLSLEELSGRMVARRAVDAAIWGMPIVNFDALRQAFFRDGQAKYNDIIWWPKGAGWKNQSLTPNTSLRYLYIFCNTRADGPVVVELPPANAQANFYGTIEDAWFVPLVDIGLEGKGGKFLVLPPDYKGDVPPGYIPLRPETYNTMTLVRSIVASASADDVRAGDTLVKQVKVYPLAKADNPPAQRLVDMTDIIFDGLVHYDDSLYISLAHILNEEPVQPRDLQMMGMLRPLGIEGGKEFKPDAATVATLKQAATETHAWLVASLDTYITPWWPDSHWSVPAAPVGPKTDFRWQVADYFDVDSRAIGLANWFGPTAKLGSGSFYFGTYHDSGGRPLRGENTYRLHVPAKVPVRDFWAFTVYSKETSALFRNSPRATLDSLDKTMKQNADGSVDIYIGPKAPAGQESNWIYTPAGQGWFPWFRAYGPGKAIFDKTFKLPDIEAVN